MKKEFLMAVAAMMLVACSPSPEEKAVEYAAKMENAVQSGDKEAVKNVKEEIAAWQASLSTEEQAKVESVEAFSKANEAAEKVLNPSLKDIVTEVASSLVDDMTEAVTSVTQEAAASAAETAKSTTREAVNTAKETADKALKDAKEKAGDAINKASSEVGNMLKDASSKANDAINKAANDTKNAFNRNK